MSGEDREMYKSIFERFYTARGEEKGKQEGKQEGRQEGRQEGISEVAKNFLADGISPDIVAKNTGLSIDDIRTMMN
jgi:predicted transposase/invertase (TIGR01784 family)